MSSIVYTYEGKVYMNLTNRCSNSCEFCIRNGTETFYDYYLWLDKEPTAAQVIEELEKYMNYESFVFCGFGEPLYRLDAIMEISDFLKSRRKNVRLNTNGQADLIYPDRDVAALLKDRLDTVNISLNAADAEKYQKICHCEFGEEGYYSMLRFAKACKDAGIRTVLSVVDCIGEEEIHKSAIIADSLGIELRVRKYSEKSS